MVPSSLLVWMFLASFVPLFLCQPVESDLGSGTEAGDHKPAQPKVSIPCKPVVPDRSRGVYMHAHDFPSNLIGAPGPAFHAHYMHAAGGIGKWKRSLRKRMMKIFKIRTQ